VVGSDIVLHLVLARVVRKVQGTAGGLVHILQSTEYVNIFRSTYCNVGHMLLYM
jgi:hypothetical protein